MRYRSMQVSADHHSVQLEVNIEGCSSKKSNVHGVGENTISKIWNTDDIDIEQPNKEASEPSKRKLENRKRKAQEAPRESKRKLMSRRNSLYGAGTIIEKGLRRSTRIKMRPLEYWKGERFLYGRVHESLVTVIGAKYASPSKEAEENGTLKVKSFVSDKYKELVDFAALH